jgi:pyruvate dehydrogenase E1 component
MNMHDAVTDSDPAETREWLDSLESVVRAEGPERARYLLNTLIDEARRKGAHAAFSANTAYLNTIAPHQQARIPGDQALAARLRALVRWNAMAMVLRANAESSGIGGHIATFSSAATLYDVGFNHFFRATRDQQAGDPRALLREIPRTARNGGAHVR